MPLGTIAIYTFVFTTIFKARWTTPSGSTTEFALVVFSGLLLFGLFADTVGRAPSLVSENVSYVKKVVFPLEILPVVSFATAMVTFLMGLTVWFAAHLVVLGLPPATAPLALIVLVPMAFLSIGLSWFLASLGVFLRDLRQVIPVILTALLFFSPILYPKEHVPADMRWILDVNPLTGLLDATRDLLLWGRIPDWQTWAIPTALSFLIFWAGYAWFMRTRKAFADVL